MSERIMNVVGANVDRWYANTISHRQFVRNQARLWALVRRLNLDEECLAIWRARNPCKKGLK